MCIRDSHRRRRPRATIDVEALEVVAEALDEADARPGGFPYVSGMISSRASFLQTWGYFEIRARLPAGAGLWPAFWLLTPGAWPPEIDAMEARGAPGYAVHVHWSEDGAHRSSGCDIPLTDGSVAFHAYGVLWTPEVVAFYLDRAPVAWIRAKPGFDRPMYALANLSVGGWAGEPDGSTPFPATYAIDRIAAWALAEVPAEVPAEMSE